MSLPSQPEEFLDHPRPVHIEAPSIQAEVDEYLQLSVLREAAGDYTADVGSIKSEIKKRRAKGLVLTFWALVFVTVGNKIFQKLQTVPMYNYPIFLNLYTNFIYIPLSFAYIVPMIKYGTFITQDQINTPKKVFAVMGALDSLAGIMQIFAATYLSGPLVILLAQAAIPISMMISRKLLQAKYSLSQYFGALVVALGILIVLFPSLYDGKASGSLMWSFIMIVSCVPMVLSSVYKEIALGQTEMDPIFMNGWVAVFQFFFSIALSPPSALVGEPPVKPGQLWDNLVNGAKCYVGVNSVTAGPHVDNCWPGAPLYVSLYLIFNVAYNILIILSLKYGSANILFMALTVTVPLGNVAFSFPFVPSHTKMKSTDLWGLLVLMLGLTCYRFGDKVPTILPAKKLEKESMKEKRRPLLDIVEEEGSDWEAELSVKNATKKSSEKPFEYEM